MEKNSFTVTLNNALVVRKNLDNEIIILEEAIGKAKIQNCITLVKKLKDMQNESKQKLQELEDSFNNATILTTQSINQEALSLD